MSDWTKLHRNNTTATQNNINKLFADIRPAFMRIDNNNNNNNDNNNQRRSSKQQQKKVNDETITSLLKLFVVNTDKTAATTIEPAVEKQLLLKNIASIGLTQRPLLVAASINRSTHVPRHDDNSTTIDGRPFAVLALIYDLRRQACCRDHSTTERTARPINFKTHR
jgi:hypothetical protein